MRAGSLQLGPCGALAGRSSGGRPDHDSYSAEHILVREPPQLYGSAEPSFLGPPYDGVERFGEAGGGKRLRRNSSDPGNRSRGSSRDDRLFQANGQPTDSRNGRIGAAYPARKAIRSTQEVERSEENTSE